MKNMLKLLLVALITITFSGVSFAQAKPATPATPATPASPEKKAEMKQEKAKASRVTGEILSLDAKAGTLRVKVNGKEMSFAAETKGAKSALEKVKVGEQVRISYTEKNGKLIARSVTEAKGEAKAKGKAKAEEKKEAKKAEAKTK